MRRTDCNPSLKYKYTYENAGFCVLCIDDFKILKNFNTLSKFSTFFTEKRHRRHLPTPQRPHDVSRGQNRYVTLPLSFLTEFTGVKRLLNFPPF